ncbi:MAG: putative Autotransporter [Arenicellales bacterium IbO2]|nr:MAG: putative Autotransporter [Arenicellales bacterium IbO2]
MPRKMPAQKAPRKMPWAACALALLGGCNGGGSPVATTMGVPPPATTAPPPPPPQAPTQLAFPEPLSARSELSFAAKLPMGNDDPDFAMQKMTFENSVEYAPFGQLFGSRVDRRLELIKASAAYARGASGAGEIVAVTDNGVLASHREFTAVSADGTRTYQKVTVSTAEGYDNVDASHGTPVAAIIAGARDGATIQVLGLDVNMHGIAYNAELRVHQIPLGSASGPYRPYDISMQTEAVDREWVKFLNIQYAQDAGAGVINFSFGTAGLIDRYDEDEVRKRFKHTAAMFAQSNVDDADKLIVVWAAGNAQGRNYPNGARVEATSVELLSGLGAYFPELQSHVLAVVSVDQNGEISSFSNRCGIAKSFCLAAPGRGLRTADSRPPPTPGGEDRYRSFTGTSAAAPVISGSLALLRQYFRDENGNRQLGNTELVTRLLATADRTGIYADSDTYGHGLVDLDAATAPVGALMTSLPGDPHARPFAGGGFSLRGGAFGAAMQDALAGVKVAAFDQLGAPFFFPAARIAQAPRARAATLREHSVEVGEAQNARLSLFTAGGAPHVEAARLRSGNWWLGYGNHDGGMESATFHMPSAFASPYLQLVRDGPGLGWSGKLPGGAGLGFALMHGAPQFANFAEQNDGENHRDLGALFEYRPRDALSLQLGAVREADGFLGAHARGDFGRAGAGTAFAGVQGDWDAPRSWGDWRLRASAYLGGTRADIDGDGMLRGARGIVSSAFALGAARASLARRGDRLGLRLSQPLRAERGAAHLRLPAGRTRFGEVVHRDHKVELAPSGRNLQLNVAYRLPIKGGAIRGEFGVERHALHDRARDLEGFLRLSFVRRF